MSDEPIGLAVPEIEDSREICSRQGKPCIYAPADEPGIIVMEWPNGVVDRLHTQRLTPTRDGRMA